MLILTADSFAAVIQLKSAARYRQVRLFKYSVWLDASRLGCSFLFMNKSKKKPDVIGSHVHCCFGIKKEQVCKGYCITIFLSSMCGEAGTSLYLHMNPNRGC